MRTRITPNMDTFYTVQGSKKVPCQGSKKVPYQRFLKKCFNKGSKNCIYQRSSLSLKKEMFNSAKSRSSNLKTCKTRSLFDLVH